MHGQCHNRCKANYVGTSKMPAMHLSRAPTTPPAKGPPTKVLQLHSGSVDGNENVSLLRSRLRPLVLGLGAPQNGIELGNQRGPALPEVPHGDAIGCSQRSLEPGAHKVIGSHPWVDIRAQPGSKLQHCSASMLATRRSLLPATVACSRTKWWRACKATTQLRTSITVGSVRQLTCLWRGGTPSHQAAANAHACQSPLPTARRPGGGKQYGVSPGAC